LAIFKRENIIFLFRYLLIGGTAAAVDWLLFTLLASVLEIQFLIAASISFVIATYTNYILGIKTIFHSEIRFIKKHELLIIFLVSGIGLIINLIGLFIFYKVFGLHLLISKVSATGLAFFWNFFIRVLFVFQKARG
jgi:putative flippase GtrA